MASDVEMPPRYKLGDDLHQVSQDLAGLRQNLKHLTGDVGRIGSHQLDNVQGLANDAVAQLAAAVRRNPLNALAIAAGLGFFYAVLKR